MPECEQMLNNLVARHIEQAELARELRRHVDLLHNARMRGRTVEAVREAYVDRYGGLILDLPSWLEEAELALGEFSGAENSEQATKAFTTLLLKTISKARRNKHMRPEVMAELQDMLGTALRDGQHRNPARTYEGAIDAYTTAIQVYTAHRYPHKFATTQNNLGVVYQGRLVGERQDNLKQAISCCETALNIDDLHNRFPEDWASIQHNLGTMYQDYFVEEEQQEYLEKAIACFQAALQVYTMEGFPEDWAIIQHFLGMAYHDRSIGEQQDNLEYSIACYEAALQVRTPEALLEDWAATQNNLSNSYLKQAIVCGEFSLEIDSRSIFAEDYSFFQRLSRRYRKSPASPGKGNNL